jgi:hypothetical protein
LTAVRKVLGDSLVLSLDRAAGVPVRLAGTRICALFSRELKTLPFVTLWDANSRPQLRALLGMVGEESAAMVVEALGRTASAETALEMLLLPLARGDSPDRRLLGVLAPLAVPSWIGTSPVKAMTLRRFRRVATEPASPLERAPRLAKVPPRAPLIVYEGGR